MLRWSDEPTPESIAQAKHVMWEERAQVERVTGIRISEQGKPRLHLVPCIVQGCPFEASALSEGRALKSWAAHVVKAHDWRHTKES